MGTNPFSTFRAAVEQLDAIAGVGERGARALLAETGTDMSRFPTHKHLASWAGRCPGNHESAGKRRSGKTPAANRHLDAVLTEMAHAAVRTKNSYFKSQYHRLAGRRGKKRAIGAVKHSLLARFISFSAITSPTRISVLTTLINSIPNNEFVTMSVNSKNSDKKWSFHLWLPEPPPPAKFSKEAPPGCSSQ